MNEQHWALQCYKECRQEAQVNRVTVTELGSAAIKSLDTDESLVAPIDERSKIVTAHYLGLVSQGTSVSEVNNYKLLAEDILSQGKIVVSDFGKIEIAAKQKIAELSKLAHSL